MGSDQHVVADVDPLVQCGREIPRVQDGFGDQLGHVAGHRRRPAVGQIHVPVPPFPQRRHQVS